jgi:hypothetical protein
MPGPLPKPESQRRRRQKPKSYGAAEAVTVAPDQLRQNVVTKELGFDAHPLIADLWQSVRVSGEAQFYSAADWERLRLELWYGNRLVKQSYPSPGAQAWAAFQAGLTAMLVSPAQKRRLGIAIERNDYDPDEEAATADIADYQRRLGLVVRDAT